MRTYRALLAALATGCLLVPGTASADIYWTSRLAGIIGTAENDGSGLNHDLISGASAPAGIAIKGRYLYWANSSAPSIGRAERDGTGVDQEFITVDSDVYGVAVDSTYVYWSTYSTNRIGRARLDGTDVDHAFITGANGPLGVTADGRFVYWANSLDGTIGRARADGSQVDQAYVSGCSAPSAISVLGSRLYWVNSGTQRLGRAAYDGTGVDQEFAVTSLSTMTVTANATHLFWTGLDIARSRLDGSGVDPAFIPGGMAWAATITPDPVAVTAQAKNHRSKLKVDVDPNLTDLQSWRFQIMKKRSSGGWKTLAKTYATEGDEQSRKINLKRGKYRAKVLGAFGYGGAKSITVTLKR